jgi:hypothetical protein
MNGEALDSDSSPGHGGLSVALWGLSVALALGLIMWRLQFSLLHNADSDEAAKMPSALWRP